MIRATGIGALPSGWSVELSAGGTLAPRIRVFNGVDQTAVQIVDPNVMFTRYEISNFGPTELAYGMEAIRYPLDPADPNELFKVVDLTVWDPKGRAWAWDRVCVRVTPWVMPPVIGQVKRFFVVRIPGENDAFVTQVTGIAAAAGVPTEGIKVIDGTKYRKDRWIQDQIELGYSHLPGKAPLDVVFNSPRSRGLRDFAMTELVGDPNCGFGWFTCSGGGDSSLNSLGNLDITPACTKGDRYLWLGRIIHGGGGSRQMAQSIRDFLQSNPPVGRIRPRDNIGDQGKAVVGPVQEWRRGR